MEEYRICLKKELANVDVIYAQWTTLVKSKKLQVADYFDGFKRCVEEQLMPAKMFISAIRECLNDHTIDENTF
ncbi:hypothetical protein, partial [Salmonella sp. s54395]|uniref:hypothetical protein n=1 Tax=Salmonella sp. s54395 TaxID=3159664 RepID=UPI003980F803